MNRARGSAAFRIPAGAPPCALAFSSAMHLLRSITVALALGLVLLGGMGCEKEQPLPDYVARVGDQFLTREDLESALQSMPAGLDTVEARKQVVEQWITNTLLFQEARRRGLREDPEVRRLLRENEQSVMVSALLSRIYEETQPAPSQSEMATYYERHKEQLRLREPFVRVRYLAHPEQDSVTAAQRLLQAAPEAAADSLWAVLAERFSQDPEGSLDLARNYYAENRLFGPQPQIREALARLRPGQQPRILAGDSLFYLLQVADRIPAGTIPEMSWVEDDLARRLAIQARKQIYARQVQRLRNEALAREELDVR